MMMFVLNNNYSINSNIFSDDVCTINRRITIVLIVTFSIDSNSDDVCTINRLFY